MSNLPRPSLEQAIQILKRNRDEYNVVLDFIQSEREQRFSDMAPSMTPYEVMSYKGEICALDAILLTLAGDWINETQTGETGEAD